MGVLLGGVDFKDLGIVIKEGVAATETTPEVAEVVWKYGAFIQQVVDFLIIAVSVFVMIKLINKLSNLRKKEEEVVAPEPAPAPEPEPTKEEILLTEIRDLLKNNK